MSSHPFPAQAARTPFAWCDRTDRGGLESVTWFSGMNPLRVSASLSILGLALTAWMLIPGNAVSQSASTTAWSVRSLRADSLAGVSSRLHFHPDRDNALNFGAGPIGDASVVTGRTTSADLAVAVTDGVATAVPGNSVVYTITGSNAGPDGVTASVADAFPATHSCTWTCAGAGGGSCTAAGSGDIDDSVNVPAGASVTYTATCGISASATGTLSNRATISSRTADPNPANNSATDADTLTPRADLAITRTDDVTTTTPGGAVTYTMTASNAGPSNAIGASVANPFPASLLCTWTCARAGGGTCTAAGSGSIDDTVNLAAGGSVTYTASCTIAASATGKLSNSATVTAPAGVTDPVPGNDSATDSVTLAPRADLAIVDTAGWTSVNAGDAISYTIVASSSGPSDSPGATVSSIVPAALMGSTWTCVGAGGGICAKAGVGSISDTVNLPVGASVTYTVSGTIDVAFRGLLSHTATVDPQNGVTDPNPKNNSAKADTDILAPTATQTLTVTDIPTRATVAAIRRDGGATTGAD